jgi:hypothetical protein
MTPIQLIINLSQSNGLPYRTEDPASNGGEYYQEEFEKVYEVKSTLVDFTRSNNGGAWKDNTFSQLMWPTVIQNNSATGAMGWLYGLERNRRFAGGLPLLLVDVSKGEQPVNYFHCGGGARITAKGYGYKLMEAKLLLAHNVCKHMGYDMVSPIVYVHQGETHPIYGTIDTAQKAEWFVDDWMETIAAIKTLLQVNNVNVQFNQLYHTNSTKQAQRELINAAFAARAAALSYVTYGQWYDAAEYASQFADSNKIQDDEHIGTQAAHVLGAQASKMGLATLSLTDVATISSPTPKAEQRSNVTSNGTGLAVNSTVGSTSWWHMPTAMVNYAHPTYGNCIHMNAASKYLENNVQADYTNGFTMLIDFAVTVPHSTVADVISIGELRLRTITPGTPHFIEVNGLNTGITLTGAVQDGNRHKIAISLKNGVVKLYHNGTLVDSGFVEPFVFGPFQYFAFYQNRALSPQGYIMNAYAHNRVDDDATLFNMTTL